MLAVVLFIAFWVVVALGLLVIAIRGGHRGDRLLPGAASVGSRSSMTLFLLTTAVFGVGLPLALLSGNSSSASAHAGVGLKLSAHEKAGRELFGSHCAVCHTLAAANASGKIGPNLDTLKPSSSVVRHTIQYGCLPNGSPSLGQACLGQGVMDPNIVEGAEADNVAAFVAKVAGQG